VRGIVLQRGAETVAISAKAIVLATGGIGGLYAATTNPREACGDGLALGLRLGARCADLEFVQFHPTALAAEGADPMPLLTEALRGEGAHLVDETGERFMPAIDARAELAPRDVVARAIFMRLGSGKKVFLDARMLGDAFSVRFPTVFAHCMRAGIDPRKERIPVAPAAHYHMGGIAADSFGRTSVPKLWACGEVAATGVHGANRLASNSLLEGVVFSQRIAKDIAGSHGAIRDAGTGDYRVSPRRSCASAELRALMYRHAGVIRDDAGLREGLEILSRLEETNVDDSDRLCVARAIMTAALGRRESRGSHFRADFPEASSLLAHRSFVAA
jgi:L-aspartate oxidase